MLLMTVPPSGLLVPTFSFPSNIKSKFCYFIRKKREIVLESNIKEILIIGDMSYRPIDELSALTEDVLVPMLTNTKNHDGWPQIVSDDVVVHIHSFYNVMCQVTYWTTSRRELFCCVTFYFR